MPYNPLPDCPISQTAAVWQKHRKMGSLGAYNPKNTAVSGTMSPTSSFSGRRWLPRNVAAAVMQSVARRWLASIFRISRVRAPMNNPPHRCYCNCCYIQPADGWVFEDVRSSAAIFDARLVTSASCDLICLSSLGFAAIFDARRRLRRRRAAAAEIQRWWWSIIYEQEEDQEEDLELGGFWSLVGRSWA